MQRQHSDGVAECLACGWRGVPTREPVKGRYKGFDPLIGHVWEGRGAEEDRCPACRVSSEALKRRSKPSRCV